MRTRPGIVLLTVILLLAVLAAMLGAATLLAVQASRVARLRADVVRARLAAEGAVRAATLAWQTDPVRNLALLQERLLPVAPQLAGGARARVWLQRLGGDLYLLRAEGRAGATRARASGLVRILALRSFLPPFPAALTVSGDASLLAGAAVAVLDPGAPPPPWPAPACDPGASDTLVSVFGAGPRPAVVAGGTVRSAGAQIDAAIPVVENERLEAPTGFGPLAWDRLSEWADRVERGPLRLAPATRDGACDRAAPGNWGAPLDAASPCAGYFPLVYVPGDLELLGGSGQGILVVDGDLHLAGEVRFYGLVLVRGGVSADAGVAVAGAVRADRAAWAGRLDLAPCASLRALAAAPAITRPLRSGPRYWVPVF